MPVGVFEVLSSDEVIDGSAPLVACHGEADLHQETGCWGCRPWLWGEEWRVVEAGETLTETRDLANRFHAEDRDRLVNEDGEGVPDEALESCYPTGTYRYENKYDVYEAVEQDREGRQSLTPGDEMTEFTWGFEIEVTADDEAT